MSAGDLLKERYPHLKLAVGEALQCPTILDNGFGGHRIEGIGDKHIPWIHNVKNTDMAIAIDDEDSQRLLRLFNTPEGQKYLKDELGMSDEQVQKFTWMGISGIANVLCCIKFAKYYELTENDVVGTVLTDSAAMYGSRVEELNELHGAYNAHEAALDHAVHMLGLKTDCMLELTYTERKRVHNLKYYTWVEQQQMDVEDLNAQWYDTKGTWDAVHAQAKELDELINEFNEATGLLKATGLPEDLLCFLHSLDEKLTGKAVMACSMASKPYGVIGGQRRYLRILHIVHIATSFALCFVLHL